jgi:hypothetical protein
MMTKRRVKKMMPEFNRPVLGQRAPRPKKFRGKRFFGKAEEALHERKKQRSKRKRKKRR